MMTDKEYWYWLCNINKIGNAKITQLLDYFETPEGVFYSKEGELKKLPNLKEAEIKEIIESKVISRIEENYAKLNDKGIYFVTIDDNNYPENLRNIYNPPISLYIRGNMPKWDYKFLAMVGARNCSDYGSFMAERFAMELSKCGVIVVSGLAAGIDSFAHKGAIKAGGETIGVLGSGIDYCYPKENFNLYMQMLEKGCIISEYGPGIQPRAYNFPMRNRIISGLSSGVFIIEAKEKSGSLITVDYGLEQGKNIYTLPGRVCDELSTGCNNLIKQGAKVVTNPCDILEDFNLNCENSKKEMKKNDKLLETQEKMVYACLSFIPKHINDIAQETNLGIGELAGTLLSLEMNHYIRQTRKNYYISEL
ncbi:MAG: DNA-processing protein DprA [Anaerocolumna sp.]